MAPEIAVIIPESQLPGFREDMPIQFHIWTLHTGARAVFELNWLQFLQCNQFEKSLGFMASIESLYWRFPIDFCHSHEIRLYINPELAMK